MTHNIFQGSPEAPYHLSVGVVAVDRRGRIGVHHFVERFGRSDVYALVSETVEGNETLQDAALRGLKEEFGAEARIVGYLGSQASTFVVDDVVIHKSTEYFVADVVSWDESRRDRGDSTRTSVIEWHDAVTVEGFFRNQRQRLSELNINDAEFVERYARSITG